MEKNTLELTKNGLTECNEQSDCVRELTLEEEMEFYKAEAKNIFDQEDLNSESSIESDILRRGMRIIRKTNERLDILAEKYNKDAYKWIPISEKKPKEYNWVLVKTSFEPGCSISIPHMAELRDGIWYTDMFDGPLEEVLDTKVIAWFDTDLIIDDDHYLKALKGD